MRRSTNTKGGRPMHTANAQRPAICTVCPRKEPGCAHTWVQKDWDTALGMESYGQRGTPVLGEGSRPEFWLANCQNVTHHDGPLRSNSPFKKAQPPPPHPRPKDV